MYAAAERIERRILRPVHVTFRTPKEWARPEDDTFLTEVKRRPLVQVAGGGTG